MNINKIVILTVLLITGILSVSARETREFEPILKKNRVWIYAERADRQPFGVPQVEKGYNNIVVKVDKDTVIDNKQCWKILVTREGKTFFRYMREYDGRLMRLDLQPSGRYKDVEILDMRVEENDKFYLAARERYIDVVRTDMVEVNGRKLKRVGTSVAKGLPAKFEWMEGIGTLVCLPIWHTIPASPPVVSCESYGEYLVHVMDDGVITYQHKDFWPEYAERLTPNTVRTDRIWIYGGKHDDNSVYKSYFRFEDEPVTHNYLIYHPFVEYKRVIWPDADNPADSVVIDNPMFIPPAYMREDGCVTYLYADYLDYFYYWNDPEIAIMYFNATNPTMENEWMPFTFMLADDYRRIMDFAWREHKQQHEVWEEEIAGEKRICYQVGNYFYGENGDIPVKATMVDGIGPLSFGYLSYMLDPDVFPYSDTIRLLDYCDAEGNVLHNFATLDDIIRPSTDPNAVDGISADDADSPVYYYNLQGQRVMSPRPGDLLIRQTSGKTEKIIF